MIGLTAFVLLGKLAEAAKITLTTLIAVPVLLSVPADKLLENHKRTGQKYALISVPVNKNPEYTGFFLVSMISYPDSL